MLRDECYGDMLVSTHVAHRPGYESDRNGRQIIQEIRYHWFLENHARGKPD